MSQKLSTRHKNLQKLTKCAIIVNVREKIKRRVYIILIKKLKYCTKEMMKVFSIMAIGFGLIIAIILMKYKPTYEVTIQGINIGYVNSKNSFEEKISEEIVNQVGPNIDFVVLNTQPEYELKLMSKNQNTNEDEIIAKLKDETSITYKYFAVTLDDKIQSCVNTLEEAKKVVNDIKTEYSSELELNLQVIEQYTNNLEEINTETVEVAECNLQNVVELIIEENNSIKVNGIKLASMPIDSKVSTIISSRFGEVSSIRASAHKGLDIACATGTEIKVIADGTVVFSGYDNTGLGYAIKVDHGNGVQTVYGHCSKLHATIGQTVTAGDIIAEVGSTGNSTGPHLHLEIRVNGVPMNPQWYIYN